MRVVAVAVCLEEHPVLVVREEVEQPEYQLMGLLQHQEPTIQVVVVGALIITLALVAPVGQVS